MEPHDEHMAVPPVRAPTPLPASRTVSRRSPPRIPLHRLPLEGRSKFAIAALAATAFAALLCAWAAFETWHFLSSIPAAGFGPDDHAAVARARTVDLQDTWTTGVEALARILCAVAFSMWFYRAHENVLRSGSARISRSSGWAVGSFFVPFVNWVVPCSAMLDVWNWSSAMDGEKRSRSSALVFVWWLTYLGFQVLAGVEGVSARSSTWEHVSVSSLITRAQFAFASRLVEVPSALAAIVLVVRIRAMQARAPHAQLAEVFE